MSQYQAGGPRIPAYKFVKTATKDKYMDLSDSHPPMFQREILPSPEDLKQKFCLSFTHVQPQGSLFFRHYLSLGQLLNLLDMMGRGFTGDPNPGPRQGTLPGFPEFKGNRDEARPTGFVSRQLDVKYVDTIRGEPLRTGPCYAFHFTEGNGVGQPQGIVTSAGDGSDRRSSIMLPLYGTKDMPPLAMHFVHAARHYLQAREVVRLSRMGACLDGLQYYAASDANAQQRLQAVWDELSGGGRAPK